MQTRMASNKHLHTGNPQNIHPLKDLHDRYEECWIYQLMRRIGKKRRWQVLLCKEVKRSWKKCLREFSAFYRQTSISPSCMKSLETTRIRPEQILCGAAFSTFLLAALARTPVAGASWRHRRVRHCRCCPDRAAPTVERKKSAQKSVASVVRVSNSRPWWRNCKKRWRENALIESLSIYWAFD